MVIGYAVDALANSRAFFWSPAKGLEFVDSHLISHGIILGGIELNAATNSSADGSIVLCVDTTNSNLYLVRIDGDHLGLTTPTNIYASLAGVAAGSNNTIVSTLPIASLSNTSGFSLGSIPAAGDVDASGGSVLRVWGSGTFMSDYGFNGDDKGGLGAVGATYFMNNAFPWARACSMATAMWTACGAAARKTKT